MTSSKDILSNGIPLPVSSSFSRYADVNWTTKNALLRETNSIQKSKELRFLGRLFPVHAGAVVFLLARAGGLESL